MDTISLAGPLKAKLDAMRDAGFTQVMLLARDLVSHPEGWQRCGARGQRQRPARDRLSGAARF